MPDGLSSRRESTENLNLMPMAEYLVDVIQGKYPSVEEGLNELNNACQELLDEYSNE